MKEKKFKKNCCYCFNVITYNRGEKEEECPYCGKIDYIKPPMEYQLFWLQHLYFLNKDVGDEKESKKYLGEMFILLRDYAKGKIKKLIRNQINFDTDKLDEKASEAAEHFIELYLVKSSFRIDNSFGGFLTWQIKAVLYGLKEQFHDSFKSLSDIVTDDKDQMAVQIDFVPIIENSMNTEYMEYRNKGEDLICGINAIINSITDEIKIQYNLYMAYVVLIGIYLNISRKNEIMKHRFYDNFGGIEMRDLVNKSMMIILKFLKEHHS